MSHIVDTRTGSSDDNTVTADDNLICSVRDAAAASTVTGSIQHNQDDDVHLIHIYLILMIS